MKAGHPLIINEESTALSLSTDYPVHESRSCCGWTDAAAGLVRPIEDAVSPARKAMLLMSTNKL